jgi:hypothetical protein
MLKSVQNEVRQTAHNQDLIEVPKRARLDREAEGKIVEHNPQGALGVNDTIL